MAIKKLGKLYTYELQSAVFENITYDKNDEVAEPTSNDLMMRSTGPISYKLVLQAANDDNQKECFLFATTSIQNTSSENPVRLELKPKIVFQLKTIGDASLECDEDLNILHSEIVRSQKKITTEVYKEVDKLLKSLFP